MSIGLEPLVIGSSSSMQGAKPEFVARVSGGEDPIVSFEGLGCQFSKYCFFSVK
jgi:hypothetical protein